MSDTAVVVVVVVVVVAVFDSVVEDRTVADETANVQV